MTDEEFADWIRPYLTPDVFSPEVREAVALLVAVRDNPILRDLREGLETPQPPDPEVRGL